MIYSILKFLCRITIISYFRRVKIDGRDKIPTKGPYIFVANHPSAFMDPIIIASYMRPKIYFIAAGEYMGKGIRSWFMQRFLQMIPVYRPSTRPEDAHKNADMFKSCFNHLGKGRSLLIFPEGVSKTELKLKPIKTGVSRIARGAELEYDSKLDLHIIPIGLNYSDPHEFRSDLYVKIGEPIKAKDFIGRENSTEGEEVRSITEAVEKGLKGCVLHIESPEDESLLRKIEVVYASNLKKEFGIEFEEQDREFIMQRELIQAMDYYDANKPEVVSQISSKLDFYFEELNNVGLANRGLRENTKALKFGIALSFVLGAPVFLIGFILNALPYFLVQTLNRKLKIDENFQGSIILASGLFIYLFWYVGITIGAYFIPLVEWWVLCLPVVAYGSGIYALIYIAAIIRTRERKEVHRHRKFDKETVDYLIKLKKELISDLEKYKEEYLAQKD